MRKTTTIAALGLAGALTLSGCGMFEPKPDEVLRSAFEDVDAQKQRRTEIRTTASEAQLRHAMESADGAMSPEDRESLDRVITTLRDTTVVMDVRSTTDQTLGTLARPEDMDWGMDVKVKDSMVLQALETGDMDLFVRADLPALMRLSGSAEAPTLAEMQSQLDAIPSGMEWMRTLVTGGWLGLDSTLAEQVTQGLEEQAGVDTEGLTGEERQQLQDALLDHSDTEKVEDGRYRMRLRVKEYVEANKDLVGKHLAAQSGEETPDVDELLARLNDGTLDMVYTVEDTVMRRVETDPMQFADLMEPAADATEEERQQLQRMRDSEMPIALDLSEDVRDFAVPDGAVRLTQQDLMMLSLMTSGALPS